MFSMYMTIKDAMKHASRRAVVSHEVKKKQHACAYSDQCDYYSELFTRMVGLNI